MEQQRSRPEWRACERKIGRHTELEKGNYHKKMNSSLSWPYIPQSSMRRRKKCVVFFHKQRKAWRSVWNSRGGNSILQIFLSISFVDKFCLSRWYPERAGGISRWLRGIWSIEIFKWTEDDDDGCAKERESPKIKVRSSGWGDTQQKNIERISKSRSISTELKECFLTMIFSQAPSSVLPDKQIVNIQHTESRLADTIDFQNRLICLTFSLRVYSSELIITSLPTAAATKHTKMSKISDFMTEESGIRWKEGKEIIKT